MNYQSTNPKQKIEYYNALISLLSLYLIQRQMGMKKIDENIVNEAMVSLIDMMAFETKKTINNYEGLKNQKVSRVLLVGGLINMPSFVTYFKQKLNMEKE